LPQEGEQWLELGKWTMGEPIEVREWMTHQIRESWTMDENEANLGREKQNPNFPN
jgi:hypothetical protein